MHRQHDRQPQSSVLWSARHSKMKTPITSCIAESPFGCSNSQAEEILNEAVAQAFAKLNTYDPARPAVNWLLGFAIKIIQQMKRHQGREAARANYVSFDEVGLVDRLHGQAAQELLGLVSQSDQQVLRLAIIEGLSGRELAV